MADKLLVRRDNSVIETYRVSMADPKTLDELEFWVKNELLRVQQVFGSIEGVLLQLNGASGGGTSQPGEDGEDGEDGDDGRGILVTQGPDQPDDSISEPGDVWIKEL